MFANIYIYIAFEPIVVYIYIFYVFVDVNMYKNRTYYNSFVLNYSLFQALRMILRINSHYSFEFEFFSNIFFSFKIDYFITSINSFSSTFFYSFNFTLSILPSTNVLYSSYSICKYYYL